MKLLADLGIARADRSSYLRQMNQWFYARGGQQHGPVGVEELRGLIRNGMINPQSDLVWTGTMPGWLPASQVPELMAGLQNLPLSDQPFAYALNGEPISEIAPGSEPIIPTACVKRAFDLTWRHIGPLLVILICFMGLSVGANYSIAAADKALGWTKPVQEIDPAAANDPINLMVHGFKMGFTQGGKSLPMIILSQVISIFLVLGVTRVGLDVVSGKPFSIGMMFSGWRWLLRGSVAYILYYIMVLAGLVLLIFPGIYLALRFGMYQTAIVDRNINIIESFKYSAQITKNNLLNLFVVGVFSALTVIAGCIALGVGLLFAYPMAWLLWILSYRWLQYGGRSVLDDPATGRPMLAAIEDEYPAAPQRPQQTP